MQEERNGFSPVFPCLCLVSFTNRASMFSAQRWPVWEGWMCMLNLGEVLIIIPKGRGIFIITAKPNSLLQIRERRISVLCGKCMVNTTGSL